MGLEAVELVLAIEETFGIDLPDADAAKLTTPRKLIEYVCARVGATPEKCMTQRSFYRVRKALGAAVNVTPRTIRPETHLESLLPTQQRRKLWPKLAADLGVDRSLERPGWIWNVALAICGVGALAAGVAVPAHPLLAGAIGAVGFGAVLRLLTRPLAVRLDLTVGALAVEAIPALAAADPATPARWTPDGVAETCRRLIREQLNIDQFSDDAEFIRDLGMD
jgi:acyl carrier protein